ncbi:hypothetical protein D3C80_468610 [compost metagenome]
MAEVVEATIKAVEPAPAEAIAEAAPAEVAAEAEAPAKPKRARRSKKAIEAEAAAAVAATEAAEVVAETVEAAPTAEIKVEEPATETAPVEATPAADEDAKPARANRASNISSSSEAVVKSSEGNSTPEGDADQAKPKKAGWWQRRGFF